MSRFAETEKALSAKLATVSGLPAVAWPNIQYTPTEGTSYVRPTHLPNVSQPLGMANDDTVVGLGFYQVDVMAGAGGGPGAALTIADAIASHFARGTKLTSGDTTVTVGVPTQGTPVASGAWFMVSVLIPYQSLYRS